MEEQLRRIQDKTAKLLEQYRLLLEELNGLKKEKIILEEKLAEKNSEIKVLELEKTTKIQEESTLNSLQKQELEKKLNHYIQEIDACINILKQ